MGKYEGTWVDVARETMTESEVYALMAGIEREIQDDPECALEQANSIVQRHYPNVVIVAWDDETAAVSGTELVDRAIEILAGSKRWDEQLARNTHLNPGVGKD
ncbi:hypothetical protein VQ042_17065 [Aurantimonas sp. A2-1-M11]|uniref:hypothetical protein n=1 Tax=Aurantimonas sp. A2-1-M11 TaxID=3113712 RepID=UPI002F9581A8